MLVRLLILNIGLFRETVLFQKKLLLTERFEPRQTILRQLLLRQISDKLFLSNEAKEASSSSITLKLPDKSLGKSSSSNALVKFLKEFNEQEEGRRFDSSLFSCNVCFAEKLGSQSIRFPGETINLVVIFVCGQWLKTKKLLELLFFLFNFWFNSSKNN